MRDLRNFLNMLQVQGGTLYIYKIFCALGKVFSISSFFFFFFLVCFDGISSESSDGLKNRSGGRRKLERVIAKEELRNIGQKGEN